MNPNLTEIILVVDNSGSMASIKKDIEGGFKTFIDTQRNQAGEAYVTQYNFNNHSTKLFEKRSINEVHGISINPFGGTALIDTAVKAIDETGQRFATLDEANRPGTILFLILTDGEENASYRYKISDLKDRVKHQQEKYNWKFVFLGANLDAIATGTGYGLAAGTTLSFATDSASIHNAFASVNNATNYYRGAKGCSVADYTFTEQERSAAVSKP